MAKQKGLMTSQQFDKQWKRARPWHLLRLGLLCVLFSASVGALSFIILNALNR